MIKRLAKKTKLNFEDKKNKIQQKKTRLAKKQTKKSRPKSASKEQTKKF